MTFDSIQAEIAERTNMTSATALARIGRTINERYKWMRSSLGLQLTVQTTVVSTTNIGQRELVFPVDKIQMVYDNTTPTNPRVLDEITRAEMRERILITEPPWQYAILHMGARTVTILLDCVPTTAFELTVDGLIRAQELEGKMVPSFPEDFHDILTYYGMEVEYRKMNNKELADDMLEIAERRVSELRFYLAKSATLNIWQGKRGRGQFAPIIPR